LLEVVEAMPTTAMVAQTLVVMAVVEMEMEIILDSLHLELQTQAVVLEQKAQQAQQAVLELLLLDIQ
jgi:hypothetical protein